MNTIKKFFMKRKLMVDSYRRLFRTDDGVKVLKDLMSVCGYSRSSFDENETKMAFYEGQRSVILRLVKTVNMTDRDVLDMLRNIEQNTEEQDEFTR
jgi:hypothetical protein